MTQQAESRTVAPESQTGGATTKKGDADDLVVKVANTRPTIEEGLEFCASKYQGVYHSSWASEPDVLFMACRGDEVVATGALELGANRDQIDTERYFLLTPRMRAFIENHRPVTAEFGRFASDDVTATKAILHAGITYCQQAGVEFAFAWANPGVYSYIQKDLGVSLWVIDVPVNVDAVESDENWVSPPVEFFIREDPPKLLLGVVPFWDIVNDRLSEQYGRPLTLVS
jgi:hypothetical protein